MRKYSPQELTAYLKGEIITWPEGRMVEGIVCQPHKPLANCLYLITKNFQNEDNLLAKLIKYHATCIVISKKQSFHMDKWMKAGIGIIKVESKSKAYLKLAKLCREIFDIPFIQVMGSSGKTTTKEMIGAVIRAKMSAMVSYENYNGPKGVAYNIFNIKDYHQAAVLEVGMKAPGVIKFSSNIVKPNIVVVTCIHRAHFIRLGSLENIIAAKAEVLPYISKDGTLIINGEDENCNKLPLHLFRGEIIKYGFSPEFDIWASDIKTEGDTTYFKAYFKGQIINCRINIFGNYNVSNALAAVMVGLKLGLSPKEISDGLAHFSPPDSRLQMIKGIKGTTLINDNFNANPDSMKLALEQLPFFAKDRPIILVLGDFESPDKKWEDYARKVHFMIGQEIARLNPDYLIAIGKWAVEYVKGALKGGIEKSKVAYFIVPEEAEEHLSNCVIPQSVIFFKASPYVPVKRLISNLKIREEKG